MAQVEIDQDEYNVRLSHANELETRGINPYPGEPFRPTHTALELVNHFDQFAGSSVTIAGRLLSKRDHGKLIFGHLEDHSGKIQTVMANQRLGAEKFAIAKNLYDTADFVGVSGVLEKTNRGEISVWADEVKMLAKSLRAIPYKLSDAETRQRQRYLDMLVNPDVRQRFVIRSQITQHMREYFMRLGCLEVETPVLDTTYGGAQAKPFSTHHNALDEEVYLRISNELYLKRLTLAYPQGVFEFSRDFRNEGMDRTHNPEFTQVELYKPYWDYKDMMDMTEDLYEGMALKIHNKTEVPFKAAMANGELKEIGVNYKKPWRRLSVYDGLREKFGIEPTKISDSELRTLSHKYGIDELTRGDCLLKLFEEAWDFDLINPTFVYDYPADTSALTKKHRSEPGLVERFEFYAGNLELGNCYTELNDPRDQRERFMLELQKREYGDMEAMQLDEDFILAQEYGMPPQAGIGLSIDRPTMLMTGVTHIREVITFPTLRRKQLRS